MPPKQRPTRPRTDFSFVSTASLIASVARTGDRPNVRLMEELVRRGPEWEPGLVAVLNYSISCHEADEDPPTTPVWLAVVAGVMRLPGAVPPLLRLLRTADMDDSVALLAAAEALAKIGSGAVDGVAEVAREGEWWRRIWAYASLGWNADPRAGEILKAALAREVSLPDGVSLADVVVKALADRGDTGVTAVLMEALRTCDPDLRGEIEEAIREIHAGELDRLIDRDWRLRYQMDPRYGCIDTGWPHSILVVTEDDGRRPRLRASGPSDRTLEAILAEPRPVFGARVDPDGNVLCACCDAPMWMSTGVWVCPANAMTVGWIQDRWLSRVEAELGLEHLFDVFDVLEEEHYALLDGPRPPTPGTRTRWSLTPRSHGPGTASSGSSSRGSTTWGPVATGSSGRRRSWWG
ncbi:MAG: HEAT repeat domain-containing protein [Longimicrobiales bacterium]